MQEVRCYQDSKGLLHTTAEGAAAAELVILSKPNGEAATSIGGDHAKALIKNRRKVVNILNSLDGEDQPDGWVPPMAKI